MIDATLAHCNEFHLFEHSLDDADNEDHRRRAFESNAAGLLLLNGRIDETDFLGADEDIDHDPWKVENVFNNMAIELEDAWRLFSNDVMMMNRFEKYYSPKQLVPMHTVWSLLQGAQPSSIRYSKIYIMDDSHEVYDESINDEALMFVTSDNKRVEIVFAWKRFAEK